MTAWIACRTCGRYLPASRAVNRAWCSAECTRAYASCVTCGRAFPRAQGHDEEHCSRQCAVQYQITRTFGPEPITVVTEV